MILEMGQVFLNWKETYLLIWMYCWIFQRIMTRMILTRHLMKILRMMELSAATDGMAVHFLKLQIFMVKIGDYFMEEPVEHLKLFQVLVGRQVLAAKGILLFHMILNPILWEK